LFGFQKSHFFAQCRSILLIFRSISLIFRSISLIFVPFFRLFLFGFQNLSFFRSFSLDFAYFSLDFAHFSLDFAYFSLDFAHFSLIFRSFFARFCPFFAHFLSHFCPISLSLSALDDMRREEHARRLSEHAASGSDEPAPEVPAHPMDAIPAVFALSMREVWVVVRGALGLGGAGAENESGGS
jgi:hypothetical protein